MSAHALQQLLDRIPEESLIEIFDVAKRERAIELESAVGAKLSHLRPEDDRYRKFNLSAQSVPAPFPIDSLPEPMKSLVIQGASASDVPPEFVALPALGICGGLIGSKFQNQVKSGWTETPQLLLAVVAEPGRGKTPAEHHARTGLERLQSAAHEDYQARLDEHSDEQAQWSRASEDERGARPELPKMTSYYTADVTMEALATLLDGSPGLVVLRDELVSWVQSCDAYRGGKGGDRAAWLSLWSGVPVKVDRKTGKSVYVEKPVVSVVGGIQPDMLPVLAAEAQRRDGFIERIMFAFPADHIPAWSDAEMTADVVDAVAQQMLHLVDMPNCEQQIRFASDTRARWVQWYNANTRLQANVGGILGGIYAKLPIQLARIALLLHILSETPGGQARSVTNEIPIGSQEDAIDLIEYFRAHAHSAVPYFGEAGVPHMGLSPERRRILEYHRKHGHASSQSVATALGLSMKSVNNMHQALVRQGKLTQPFYGTYTIADQTQRLDRTGGSAGFDGNSQELRDSTRSTTSRPSQGVICSHCGAPTSRSVWCETCQDFDPGGRPF